MCIRDSSMGMTQKAIIAALVILLCSAAIYIANDKLESANAGAYAQGYRDGYATAINDTSRAIINSLATLGYVRTVLPVNGTARETRLITIETCRAYLEEMGVKK